MRTLEQVLIPTILVGMAVPFVWDRLPPVKAFVGFGDQAVILVASVLVLGAAIDKAGVVGCVIRRLEPRRSTTGPAWQR